MVFVSPQGVELRDHRFDVVCPRQFVQEVAHELVEAGAPHGGDTPGFGDDPVVNGQCDVQGFFPTAAGMLENDGVSQMRLAEVRKWSGREDLNLRPLGPEPSALPG